MNESSRREAARQKLQKAVNSENLLQGFGSRQPNQEQILFKDAEMTSYKLLKPPYDPAQLEKIVEASAKLNTCIEIMQQNVDGYGYEFQYIGDKSKEDSKEVIFEYNTQADFFAQVNENQSFLSLKKELRRDIETTGNFYIEVVRYTTKEISTLYRIDPKHIRLQAKQDKPYPLKINLKRNGQIKPTTIYKRFRRYAVLVNSNASKVRWFKELGDPRKMCAITGKYETELEKGEKIIEEASEVIHMKQGNSTYGVPRFVGLAASILGINYADKTNMDLFQNNAIPALAILVSNGRLTTESIEELAEVLEGMKGPENRHKVAILESFGGDDGNIDDKSTSSRISFEELNRQSDSEFQNYVRQSEQRIRSCFRLPPLMSGDVEDFSRSTSDSAKMVAEEQVFQPIRTETDELINFTLLKEMGIKYFKFRTVGPKLMDSETMVDALGKLARAGALTVNDGVKIANRVLNLDKPLFDGSWAQIPIAILLELMKKNHITEIEGVGNAVSQVKEDLSSKEFDTVSEDLEEVKDQLDQIFNLIAKTD